MSGEPTLERRICGFSAGYPRVMSNQDPQDQSEEFDGNVLGEHHTDDEMPGANFPPDRPLGVEDPSIVQGGSGTRDSVASRDERHRSEDEPATPDGDIEPQPGLPIIEH